MIVYADTSFLFSLYVSDVNSTAAAAIMSRFRAPLLTTDFGEFEFTNAVSWRVFRKQFLIGQQRAILDSFSKDVEAGIIRIAPIPAAAFGRAKHIAEKETPVSGNRALDVLHVASALVLMAASFYTFDRKQARLAATLGLRVP
ncbi:MAG: type II toxin-antitoxin system VapC family toxin [Candidatus Acidiferrum sp.]